MRAVVAVGCLVVSAAVGCGPEHQLDTAAAERSIARGIARETGAPAVNVECPNDVELRRGNTFECIAEAGGRMAVVRVEQLDDEGRVRWRVAPGR